MTQNGDRHSNTGIEHNSRALAHRALLVRDSRQLGSGVAGPVSQILPHDALLCGQLASHSGGWAAVHQWSSGVPSIYLAKLSRPGGNLRSPIFERLLRTPGQPQFFDPQRDAAYVDAQWLSYFKEAGWRNVLGLTHVEKQGDDVLLTAAAFYSVAPSAAEHALELQRLLMPYLHAVLSSKSTPTPAQTAPTVKHPLTVAEEKIAALVVQGHTNKQIAKLLGKSDQTVKNQLSAMMRKFEVENRTQLTRMLTLEQDRDGS